jgi:ATP-binding cassette subfamily E protein 1
MICVHKCPVQCVDVVNLPAELNENPLHQYGENTFRVYRLPYPKSKSVVGLIGRNGIGKTTALNIIAGKIVPNLGDFEKEGDYQEVINLFKGKEIQAFFEKLKAGNVSIALKPQNVELIAKSFKGKVGDLLKKVDEKKGLKAVAEEMTLSHLLEHDIKDLSGGELQRVAIAATLLKEAEVYAFDEPSSYLDVKERLRISKALRRLAIEGKGVLVIEHDLAVLDYLSDYIHIVFGKESVFGVVSNVKSVRNGINEFLEGYIKDENIRFRDKEITFDVKPPTEAIKRNVINAYPALEKKFKAFSLKTEAGELKEGEVIGILGANAIGKTTFVKMLAGVLKPNKGTVSFKGTVAYKPQYLVAEKGKTVRELFSDKNLDLEFYNNELKKRLDIDILEDSELQKISGGELQRVAVALTLSQNADIYLLDEPSAFLDIEQRLHAANAIRNLADKKGKVVMVVDHDILFQDYVSDRLIVFEGESGKKGLAGKAVSMKEGMNKFLKMQGVTYRRDPQTGRPRANKPGSVKDQEQKKSGNYYYSEK